MLRVRNLVSGYGKLRILKGISLHVNAGEIVTIIGANGAGKTTLLNTIASLLRPLTGTVGFRDTEVTGEPAERIVAMGCALVPEGRQLFAPMTVRENLILGGYTKARGKNRGAVQDNLRRVYTLFPRLEERQGQLAGTLSGGEQQMVAIGRALMSDPDLILMDEPSMGLAPLIVREIFRVVTDLRERGKTILIVEQNARAVLEIADRGYVMETGSLVLEGASRDLLDNNDVQRAYLGKDYRAINE